MEIVEEFKQNIVVGFFGLFITCYFKFFFNPSNCIIINYNYFHELILRKLQDHVFICSIWINFETQNICWSLNFLNNSMSKIINLHFIYILSKTRSGLVVKTLVHLHENLVQTLMNACMNICNVNIHWCIMNKYGLQNIYNDGEYL
jgi:hypothetical protein